MHGVQLHLVGAGFVIDEHIESFGVIATAYLLIVDFYGAFDNLIGIQTQLYCGIYWRALPNVY